MPAVTITIDEDGSYIVDGDVSITDDHGRELDLPYEVQLCRCGVSRNQPFCDGAHTAIDFDVLFNLAGAQYFNPLEDISDEEWDSARRNEVDLVFYLTRAAWRHLHRSGGLVKTV